MQIKKKCWPEYFEKILSGEKKYELRLNDFDCQPGDTLVLEEWNPKTGQYTGRSVSKNVTYVGRFKLDQLFWPKEEIEEKSLQVISLT